MNFTLFDMFEKEANYCINYKLVLRAYDYVLKCSLTFYYLDARGDISTTKRRSYILRVKDFTKK
uniref:glycine--tRNA ligase subunit alpha n=1 Tax=Streptobacillus moniliformis TaxID=34105 RepID=UPI0007E4099C|nr:glycine--tRNA ligase subunit alpha [Streptobacillus moniliformis]